MYVILYLLNSIKPTSNKIKGNTDHTLSLQRSLLKAISMYNSKGYTLTVLDITIL